MSKHPISQLLSVAKDLVLLKEEDPGFTAAYRSLRIRAKRALKTPPVVNKDLASARKLSIKARQDKAAAFKRQVMPHIERAKRNGCDDYSSIARYLNLNQVVSPRGTQWLPNTVRRILTN